MYQKILVLAVLLSGVAWAAPRQPSPWDTKSLKFSLRHTPHSLAASLDDDSLHRFDVLKISPNLNINVDSHTISASAVYQIVASQIPLSRIDLRFTASLAIDSVWGLGAQQVTFTRTGLDSLQLLLSPVVPLGDTVEVGVAYHGTPATIDSWGGFRFLPASGDRPNIGFSMGDGLDLNPPPANYNWLPTHADPTDKVLWDCWMYLYGGQTATQAMSVGDLVDSLHTDSYTAWHYRLTEPVSTYLLAVSVANYTVYGQQAANPRIVNWVYPGRLDEAQVAFSNVPTVLNGFADRFGPYPWNRFGCAMTPIGDMEQVTCVFHVDFAVQANHNYDWLIFHEMSHQWWGDWVTCGDWRDLWLNEGFATYCEALSMEILHGPASYINYVTTDLFQTAMTTQENFPIYNPQYYWGATVYEKGACVMHMLRQLLGDSAFFQAWREYGQEHAYGNAVTTDWQAKLEEHYGSSLQWFFDEWVYNGTRFPQYDVDLEWTDVHGLIIHQAQNTGTLFRMPLDVRIVTIAHDTCEFTIWNDAVVSQTFTGFDTCVTAVPVNIVLDPYEKVLNTATYQMHIVSADEPREPLPREFRISSVSPNPFNSTAVLHFDLPKSSSVRLRVYDLLGRQVEDRSVGALAAGRHQTFWNGSNAASGVYLFRLETDHDSRMAKAVLLK